MSLASRLVLEAEIETATRLEQLLTRDHRQTATPRGDHSMALGRSPTAVVDFGAVKIQVDGRRLLALGPSPLAW